MKKNAKIAPKQWRLQRRALFYKKSRQLAGQNMKKIQGMHIPQKLSSCKNTDFQGGLKFEIAGQGRYRRLGQKKISAVWWDLQGCSWVGAYGSGRSLSRRAPHLPGRSSQPAAFF